MKVTLKNNFLKKKVVNLLDFTHQAPLAWLALLVIIDYEVYLFVHLGASTCNSTTIATTCFSSYYLS